MPSPENMITSAEEQEHERAEKRRAEAARLKGAYSLGGLKAADEFRADLFVPSLVTDEAFRAAAAFDAARDSLYIFGPTGSGKSHLAAIAARRSFLRPGADWVNRVCTVTPMKLSRVLRGCDSAAAEEKAFAELLGREVLVIDDLGVEKDTEFLVSAIYEVVNLWYQNRGGGLIVTSNLSLGDLAMKLGDDRVSSRLAEMCRVFNLTGEKDHRLPKK